MTRRHKIFLRRSDPPRSDAALVSPGPSPASAQSRAIFCYVSCNAPIAQRQNKRTKVEPRPAANHKRSTPWGRITRHSADTCRRVARGPRRSRIPVVHRCISAFRRNYPSIRRLAPSAAGVARISPPRKMRKGTAHAPNPFLPTPRTADSPIFQKRLR